jgi:hypothetical protein
MNGTRPGLSAEQQPPGGVGEDQRLGGVSPSLARSLPGSASDGASPINQGPCPCQSP